MAKPVKAEFWDWNKLTPAERVWSDSIAAAAEDNFFVWAKEICGLDRLVPRIHEPICRFMSAPILGKNMPDAIYYETDWTPSDQPVKRGSMRAGDPFGEPFNRQHRLSDPPRLRQLLRVGRGAYKTSLLVAFILWVLRRDVNKSVMVMGADDNAASKILAACDRHIRTNAKLAHYWGMDKWIGSDPWTVMSKFIATRTTTRANDPSIWATSPGSCKAGPHPDICLIDDIINDRILMSDEASDKANSAFDMLSPMLTKNSIVLVTGTPWSAMDLYDSLERRKTLGGQHLFDIYTRDAINPDGTLWFKELFDEEFLSSKWTEAQNANPPKPWLYWSQYRMQPVTEAEQSLMLEKIAWVQQEDIDKAGKLRRIGGVDPADEKSSSGSWALWAWGTTADKHFWDLDLQKCSAKGDMMMEIVKFVVRHSLEVLVMENTVISRRLIADVEEKLRERNVRCSVVTVEPHSASKQRRIMEVENGFGAVMAQGRLHLRDTNFPIKNELRTFPGGNYTYDALDIGSYITAWVAANGFYPRAPKDDSAKPMTQDERIIAAHHASCDKALKRRDQLAVKPEFTWERPGIRKAVRC